MIKNELQLIRPELIHAEAVMNYRREFFEYGEKQIYGSAGLHHYDNYEDWLKVVRQNEVLPVSEETTPADTYLAFRSADQVLIGTIQLRHSITKTLRECGGHIGYAVRPLEREKGYATEMLSTLLPMARELGLTEVRIDCDKCNHASRHTILKCGGIFDGERTLTYGDYTEQVFYYYIFLQHPDERTREIKPAYL